MFYVNVYEMCQRYGGPEEGGWYFDAWIPARSDETEWDEYGNIIEERFLSFPCKRRRQAERIAKRLEKKYTFDQRSYTSALQLGGNYDVRIENEPPKYFSNYQPYC